MVKKHYIFIEDKFVSGVKSGAINALIFDRVPSLNMKADDIIVCQNENQGNIQRIYKHGRLIASAQFNDTIAQKCGFKTVELLLDELYNRFGHEADDNHIYFVLYLDSLSQDKIQRILNGMKWNALTCTANLSYYNPEYDEKPWRD